MIEDHIQNLADDIYGVLNADEGLYYVPVFRSRTPLPMDEEGNPIPGQSAVINDQIEDSLAGVKAKNGKSGIAVVVMLPEVDPESENSLGPSLRLMPRVRIIEDRLINESGTGTGISSSRLALHIAQVLHRRCFRSFGTLFVDPKKMIEEVSLPDDRQVHEVMLVCSIHVDTVLKVRSVQIANEGGAITLTTGTPDAEIWYTLNGGWPAEGSEGAVEYTGPLTPEPGSYTLRAAAYKAGMQASDDLWAEITISA